MLRNLLVGSFWGLADAGVSGRRLRDPRQKAVLEVEQKADAGDEGVTLAVLSP